MRRRPLTELEGTVLGVVWSRQPCTAYQVRRQFADSPSPHWSGSAGAIYPLVARLEEAGLLRSQAHTHGSRKSRLYRLTAAGRSRLVAWIGPPIRDDVAGVPPDPLRARIAFLGALPPGRRRRFLEHAEARIADFLERSNRPYGDATARNADFDWMVRGAVAMQAMRLEWVRSMATTSGPAPRKRRARSRTRK